MPPVLQHVASIALYLALSSTRLSFIVAPGASSGRAPWVFGRRHVAFTTSARPIAAGDTNAGTLIRRAAKSTKCLAVPRAPDGFSRLAALAGRRKRLGGPE